VTDGSVIEGRGWRARRTAEFRCERCQTVNGCEEHRVFRCGACGRPTWWSDGAADDCPDDCSECWHAWYLPRQQIAQALAELLEMI